MSLDAPKSDAELLALHAQRTRKAEPSRPLLRALAVFDALPYPKATSVAEPITLRIPWSCLISDNDKYGVLNGKLILTREYRAAKQAIGALARDAMGDRPPAQCPLSFVARVYLPNNRRHDVLNFGKVVNDGLEGVVYVNDEWLHDNRWIRAGVDVDAPRAELVLTPLTGTP